MYSVTVRCDRPLMPRFTSKPDVKQYLRKPLLLWDPEWQFGTPIKDVACCVFCKAEGTVVFKEYSTPRHVHSYSTDSYYSCAVYRCKKCSKTIRMDDEGLVCADSSPLVPPEIFLQCPVVYRSKTCWSRELVELMVDLVSSRAHINDFINAIRKARTSEWLKIAVRYYSHVRWWLKNRASTTTFSNNAPLYFDDFPEFFSHCDGWNGTLGPSRQVAESFNEVTDQQSEFWRHACGATCVPPRPPIYRS